MVHQRNRRIHSENGFFGSFDAPWSEWSWINLFNKEAQNPFLDSFGFKNPILDFLKETHARVELKASSSSFWGMMSACLVRKQQAWQPGLHRHLDPFICSFFFFNPTDRPTFTRGRAMGNETFYGDSLIANYAKLGLELMCTFCNDEPENLYHLSYKCLHSKTFWGPFLESPGNFSGP